MLPEVPRALIDAILAGRCVAFVGAGFSAAAGLPDWQTLLGSLATVLPPDARQQTCALLETPSAHHLDQAAQAIEDSVGRSAMIELLKDHLNVDPLPPEMAERIGYLRGIPLRAIVTTNFDALLAGQHAHASQYREALRGDTKRWWHREFWGINRGAPVLHLHGCIADAAASERIVLTRRDYRRRLYGDAGYESFLTALLSTTTVLFLGCSFEDAYLNEARSKVLSLIAHQPGDAPLAYALMADATSQRIRHFRDHEGIQVLSYSAADEHAAFTHWLQSLHDQTATLPRFGSLLAHQRLLWVDPEPANNAPVIDFLKRASAQHPFGSGPSIVIALSADDALRRLTEEHFDLVITHWGYQLETARQLLLARPDMKDPAPVIVFSTAAQAESRKREALRLGAQSYSCTFGGVLRQIEAILSPAITE